MDFDTERWLKQWPRQPQPALGGARLIDLLGTQAETQAGRQVLAAMESGAFHSALIMRAVNGSPNSGEHMQTVTSTHGDMLAFAQWWISRLHRT